MTVNITETFEFGAAGWSDSTTAVDAGFSEYLQLTQNSSSPIATQKTFDVSDGSGDVTVVLDFYEIDDNEAGEDEFLVFVDGVEVFALQFDGAGSDAQRSGTTGDVSWVVTPLGPENSSIGEGSANDQLHRITLTISNIGDSFTLGFGEQLDAGGESYGIDNVQIARGAVDTDGDGVADDTDLDDDNDGILDTKEGGITATDSGIDGALGIDDGTTDNTAVNVAFGITSNDVDDPSEAHFLDSITVDGTVYTDFILPDDYQASAPDGSRLMPTSNIVRLTVNGTSGVNNADPTYESVILTEAFQSRNLNAYQTLDNGNYSDSAFTLTYNNPITITAGGFIAISERGGNNSTTVTALDANGNILGSVTADQGVDYLPNTAQQNNSQDANIALYQLDDLGAVGAQISQLVVTFPDGGGVADQPDGKIFIFGDQSLIQERDTDGDGVVDRLDIDSDDDGITDNVEAQTTQGYIAPSGTVDSVTGIDTAYGAGLSPVDTDSDGVDDYIDIDSDDDGIADADESGNGVTRAAIANSADTDGDGLKDVVEGGNVNDGFDVNDENLDGTDTDFLLADSDNDTAADGSDATPTTRDLDYRDDVRADAEDDVLTVTESEPDGDTDLNVLTNDVGADLAVVGVGSSTGGVGTPVDGSNGGTFTISATGDLDFDAGEDFEFLDDNESAVTTVEYTIRSPEPFDAGTQTVQTSGDVGAGGQEAFFTLSGPLLTDNDDGIVNARIDLTGATQPTYNILFVMDVSGSTGPDFGSSFAGAGDLNGDGTANNIIDAEIAALRQLSTEIGNLGFTDDEVQIGLVTFDDPNQLNPSNEIILEGTNDQSFDAGSSALSTAIATAPGVVTVSGGTDFEAALNLAITWFENQEANGDARDNNIVYFLSDGQNFSGTDFSQEASALQAIATVNAVGITAAADEVALGTIDSSGTAQEVDTLAQLNAALEPPFLDATITDFRVFVNGVEDTSIDASDLTPDGTGFVFNPATLSGLDSTPDAVNMIVVEADFDNDGDGTADETLTNTITVATPDVDTATVTVTVTGENDAPDAVNDTASTDEDTAITIDVLTNDSDVDDEPLTITDVTGATGLVTINDNGTPGDPTDDFLDYDPNGQFDDLAPNESVVDTFTYTISDGDLTDTATVSVTVTGVNDTPVAVDDAVTTDQNTAIDVDVLLNDTDVDGGPLQLINVIGGAGTAVSIDDNGTPGDLTDDFVTYDPTNTSLASLDDGESFVDVLTYVVSDGIDTDQGTLSVTITGVNDAPIALPDAATVTEDATTAIDVLANDVDPDDEPLTITDVTGATGLVTINDNGTPNDPTDDFLDYDPNGEFDDLAPGESRVDTFTYTVSDGDLTDTATVSVTVTGVNDTPVGVDDTDSTDEDTTTSGNVLTNDTDVDNVAADLSVTEVDGVAGDVGSQITLGSGALLTLNSDGSYDYDPNGQFEGLDSTEDATDTFTYTVSDGDLTDMATVTITINGVNDAPIAVDDDITTSEGSSTTGDVLADNGNGPDSDPDDEPLTVTEVNGVPGDVGTEITLASGALLTLNSDGTFDYDPNGQFEDVALGQTETDTFTYTVSDGDLTDTATVTVTIQGENDDPTAVADNVTAAPNEALGDVDGNVIDNDTDVDGDTLTVIEVNGDDAVDTNGTIQVAGSNGGTFVVNADGTFDFSAGGDFEDVPQGGNRSTSFTYTISDGNGGTSSTTANVTVLGQNNAPVAEDDDLSTDEDTSVSGNVLDDNGNGPDSDVDGTSGTLPGTSQTITELNGNAGQIGTQVTLTSGALLTLNDDGTFDYDPNGQFETLQVGQSDTDTFTYTLSDGVTTDTATVTITINGVNDAPVAEDDDFGAGATGTTTLNVLANDSDPDADPLTITDVNGATGLVTINDNGTPTDPTDDFLVYDPNGQFDDLGVGESRADTFTYTISDGDLTDTATVTVIVAGGNESPTATPDAATIGEDETTPITIDLTANDTDPDTNDDLRIISVTGSTGFVSIVGTGADRDTIAYVPDGQFEELDDNETAVDTFSYIVSDGNGGQSSSTVSVTITGANDAPEALDDTFTGDEDTVAQLDVLANDTDPDDEPLTITAVDAPGVDGIVTINDGGTPNDPSDDFLEFDPDGQYDDLAPGESVVETFTYTVSDGDVTDTATVSFTVTGVNDDPDAVDDAFEVSEDGGPGIDILANDSDIDGGTVSILTVNGAVPGVTSNVTSTGGRVAQVVAPLAGATTFEIDVTDSGDFDDLDDNETDTVTVSYTITDGQGGTDTATITVTVNGANDAPTPQDDTATTDEDTAITIDVLANDTDPDDEPLTITGVTGNTGTVTINRNGTPNDPTDDFLDYDPSGEFDDLAPGESRVDTFTYTVSDGDLTETATISVTVSGVNDDPDAVDDTFNVSADGVQDLLVLLNDSDVDGDDLEIVSVSSATGLVTINDNGTPGDTTDDFIDYDPNGQFDGLNIGETATDTFTYTISDGTTTDTATVNLIIGGTNNAPTAVDDTATVNQGQSVLIDVVANDTDPNAGDVLRVVAINGTMFDPTTNSVDVANGTVELDDGGTPADLTDDQLLYTPNFTFAGPGETFTYTVSDGRGGTSTAEVAVAVNPNIPPFIPEPVVFDVFEGETLAADIDATDFDSPASVIRFAIRGTGPDDALFTLDEMTGELRFVDLDPSTPEIDAPDFENPDDADGNNVYELDVSVSDEFNTNTQRIRVNVLDVDDQQNLAPDIKAPDPFNGDQLSDGPVLDFVFTTSSGVITTVETTDPNSTDVLDLTLFGEDADLFAINDVTGELTLRQPLVDANGRPLSSADGDPAFEVLVRVEDQDGLQDTIALNYILIAGF